jgi:hypothetical protein
VTGELVSNTLRNGLPARFEVRPAMKFKGRLFGLGIEPAGPDATLVTAGVSGLWRAQVTVVRGSGDTQVLIRSGGETLYSALGVSRKVRRVLQQEFGSR